MNTEQNKALLQRYNKEVIENGDMSVLDKIMDEDFVNQTPDTRHTSQ